jgi:hypothetical protein
MKTDLAGLINRLRLPSWQKADIEAELAAHLQEAAIELRAQGVGEAEAQAAALARFGDLESLAESLQEIHKNWKGGTTVQQRLVKKLVLGVILFCLVAMFALPQIREMGQSLRYSLKVKENKYFIPIFPLEQLQQGAKQFPDDVYVQLALAESELTRSRNAIMQQRPHQKVNPSQFLDPTPLRKVAARFPNSPAAQLRLAVQLLAKSGELQREEVFYGTPKALMSSRPAPRKHTPEELAALDEAIQHLRVASRLAPDNAAPEYLLAYAWFAKKEDTQADAALRAALVKPSWTLYTNETRKAALKLYVASDIPAFLRPDAAWAIYSSAQFVAAMDLSGLARLLAELGAINHQAGNNNQAVFYYQSGIQLGHRLLAKAESIMDVLYGLRVNAIPSYSFITWEDRQQIQAESTYSEKILERLTALRQKRFRDYMTAQRRSDLADLNEADYKQGTSLKTHISLLNEEFNSLYGLLVMGYRQIYMLLTSWLFTSYIIILLLIVGLLSLFSRSWKAQGSPPVWRWRNFGWLLLVLGLLFTAAIWAIPSHPELMSNSKNKLLAGIFGSLMLIAALLIALFPLIGGLLKRRRQSPETRMGKSQVVLASYRLLLPPLFAVMLVFALVSTFTAQLKVNRWAEDQYRKIEQGEVQYWQNNSPEK